MEFCMYDKLKYSQSICFIQHERLDKKDHTIMTGIERTPSNNQLDILPLNYSILSSISRSDFIFELRFQKL
jgi:hypothetical protein